MDVALVLALDSSSSVSSEEFELQLLGLADAFRRPELAQAVARGAHGAIAVAVVEWSNANWQEVTTPFVRLSDAASLAAFADEIARAPRVVYGGGTSISGGLDFARGLFAESGFLAERLVIDVSGDGSNNQGRALSLARQEALDQGITINGLAILNEEPQLEHYYRQNVIGGPGAFVIAAQDYESFGEAMLRKLLREVAEQAVAALP